MTLEKGDIVLTGTPKGVRAVNRLDVITAGVKVDGKEIEEGKIEVNIKDLGGPPIFKPVQGSPW